jgi:hypothetical protein
MPIPPDASPRERIIDKQKRVSPSTESSSLG